MPNSINTLVKKLHQQHKIIFLVLSTLGSAQLQHTTLLHFYEGVWLHHLNVYTTFRPYTSFPTWISSPRIVFPSILTYKLTCMLTHFPILLFHPIIALFTKLWLSIVEPSIKVEWLILTPSRTSQFGPITTFGPIRQVGEIFALGC